MHRQAILSKLETYSTSNRDERFFLEETKSFIKKYDNCFERSLQVGHVTGSAWIVNPSRTHALMIHHVKLNKWIQPGGHCDGDSDVLQVALKEANEETGLYVRPVSTCVFDIDVHLIPERNFVPQHIHYDIRFLLEAEMKTGVFQSNREVSQVEWLNLDIIRQYNNGNAILRMIEKTVLLKNTAKM